MTQPELAVSSESSSDPYRGQLVLGGVIVAGGLSWPLMKITLASVEPEALLISRLIFATVGAFLVAWTSRNLRWPKRREAFAIGSVAVLQLGAFLWLITVGLSLVPAGRAALLAYTSPIWVIPLATCVLGERLTRSTVTSLGFGLAGLAALFLPSASVWSSSDAVAGNLCLLAAALVWATQITLLRRWPSRVPTLQLFPWQLLCATVILGVLSWLTEGRSLLQGWDWSTVAIAAYVGLISTTLVFWGMLFVARVLPALSSTIGFLGIPGVGLLASTLILAEPLNRELVVGFALIGVAVTIQATTSVRAG